MAREQALETGAMAPQMQQALPSRGPLPYSSADFRKELKRVKRKRRFIAVLLVLLALIVIAAIVIVVLKLPVSLRILGAANAELIRLGSMLPQL